MRRGKNFEHGTNVIDPAAADIDLALTMVGRQFSLSPNDVERLTRDIEQLRQRIADESALSLAERRNRRRARIGALKATRTALQRSRNLMMEQPQWILGEIQHLIAPEIAELFSNAAFRQVGAPIITRLDTRVVESLMRYRQPGDAIADEIMARSKAQRRVRAGERGVAVLLATLDSVAACLTRELEREVLQAPDGRPGDRPRQIAMAGLWDIYSKATGSVLPKTPPRGYLDLCAAVLPALGQSTTGLDEAAERLFARAAGKPRAARRATGRNSDAVAGDGSAPDALKRHGDVATRRTARSRGSAE